MGLSARRLRTRQTVRHLRPCSFPQSPSWVEACLLGLMTLWQSSGDQFHSTSCLEASWCVFSDGFAYRIIESFQFATLQFSWTHLFFFWVLFFSKRDEAQLHSVFYILFAEGWAAWFRNDDRKDSGDKRYQISSDVPRVGRHKNRELTGYF